MIWNVYLFTPSRRRSRTGQFELVWSGEARHQPHALVQAMETRPPGEHRMLAARRADNDDIAKYVKARP